MAISDLTLDLSIFIIINLANISILIMFMLRVKKREWAEYAGGLFNILGFPTLVIAIINLANGRDWWLWTFPLLFFTFTMFSILVDDILKINFRNPKKYNILVPYLLLFYISIILMWGITWSIDRIYGAITGITYFLQLGGAAYAGKHGVG